MANYAIMRMEKRKLNAVARIDNHHERLKERYKSNPDIDPELSHLNYHIKEPQGRYRQKVLNRIEESGARRRKDSVVLQDCLVTASPDWINELTHEQQVEFFNHAYEYFTKNFGEENIISAVVHMDEANPHMHLCFVPITKDNRLSSKELIGGPKGLVKHQDNFHAHMVEKYPDLSRGISSKITHRKHIPTEFYKNATMLYEHQEEIVNAINNIGLINNAKKRDEAIALLSRYAPELGAMKNQLKTTDKYIDTFERSVNNLRKTVNVKEDTIADQQQEIDDLKWRLRELNGMQKKLMKQIDKIPPEYLKKLAEEEKRRRNKEERDVR